jgi:glucan phosphoethanolaminetransferase (alkaline phosphatase superfamily)
MIQIYNRLKNLKNNKYYIIIIIFIILMLLPSFAMIIFSDDSIVKSPLKKLFFPIFSISFILLFIALVRTKVLLILFIPIFIFSFIEIYTIINLKSPTSSGTFAAVINTHWHEATEILSTNWMAIVLLSISLPIYIFISIKFPFKFKLPFKIKLGLIATFLIVQISIVGRDVFIAYQIKGDRTSLKNTVEYFYLVKLNKTFPINLYFSLTQYAKGKEMLNHYNSEVLDFSFGAKVESVINEREIYVVVIGETARRKNFSLYGYNKKTNPFLEKQSNLICFNNTTSSANLTSIAYPQFITRATPENYHLAFKEPSISIAFKEAGFKTFYISNQMIGQGSVYGLYTQEADSIIALNSSSDMLTNDATVLPYFNKIIDNKENDKILIIIHSMGSHFRYNLRHTDEFSIFTPTLSNSFSLTSLNLNNKEVLTNSYDNSILFTDYFLSQLIRSLEEQQALSTLLYASDHGENLFDDNEILFGHGSSKPTKYELEIPFIIWYSDSYKNYFESKIKCLESNIESPISTPNFFHTAIDLANITIDKESDMLSVSSPFFVPSEKRGVLTPDYKIFYY